MYDVHFPLFILINLLINHMKFQVCENIFLVFLCDTYFEGVTQKYIETSCIFITCCLQQEYDWVQYVELTWLTFILLLRYFTKHIKIQSLSYLIYVNTWHPFVRFCIPLRPFGSLWFTLINLPSLNLDTIYKITEGHWEYSIIP